MESLDRETGPDPWPQIAPFLDEAVAQLGEDDRNAVALRFYQQKPLEEVGRALGMSATAAQKRVSRALEKLRKFFGKRGVTLSAAAIAGAVSANAVQAAPAALSQMVASSALAVAKGAAVGGSTLTLAKGSLKLMAWTKAKTAVLAGAGVLLAAGIAAVAWKRAQMERQFEEQLAHQGVTQMRLTGTAGAAVVGSYTQNGQRVAFSNSLPWSFSGTNISDMEFRKANPNHAITVNLISTGTARAPE
jgi:hypothetical protein